MATEKYENREIHGLTVKIYKNKGDYFKKLTEQIIRAVMKGKNFITSMFTLALFVLSLDTINFSLKDWSTRVSSVFALLVISMTLYDMIKGIKKRNKQKKYMHNAVLIKNNEVDDKIEEILDNVLSNNGYHPVAYIAFKLHLIESVYIEDK